MVNWRFEVSNHIIQKFGFKRYLEIGVHDPVHCFDKVNAETKHSVDPGLDIKRSGLDFPNKATYKFTSDDFFTRLEASELDLSPDYKWDVIFIDGLHVASQVERDILNGLNHLSPNGVIVLHDGYPFMSGFSHDRVIEDFIKPLWNGTVWKAIYKLRATRSDLITNTLLIDEGVSLVKRGESELIPFNNPFYEYTYMSHHAKEDLGLISPNDLDKWLDE